jgi:uncharacterized protein (TIGR02646 family)
MRKINKNAEPISLTDFKINNPSLKYSNLSQGNDQVRIDIRVANLKEQFYLCGYCCNKINETNSHNEHIIPQNSVLGSTLTLDFENNIIASCNSVVHCGHKKGNNTIDLTPLMSECESEIVYQLNGKMTHTTQRAQATINTLQLRNPALENKRKIIIDIILFDYVEDITDLKLEEDWYLNEIIKEISTPDNNGKVEAFVPIIVNVVKQFIS